MALRCIRRRAFPPAAPLAVIANIVQLGCQADLGVRSGDDTLQVLRFPRAARVLHCFSDAALDQQLVCLRVLLLGRHLGTSHSLAALATVPLLNSKAGAPTMDDALPLPPMLGEFGATHPDSILGLLNRALTSPAVESRAAAYRLAADLAHAVSPPLAMKVLSVLCRRARGFEGDVQPLAVLVACLAHVAMAVPAAADSADIVRTMAAVLGKTASHCVRSGVDHPSMTVCSFCALQLALLSEWHSPADRTALAYNTLLTISGHQLHLMKNWAGLAQATGRWGEFWQMSRPLQCLVSVLSVVSDQYEVQELLADVLVRTLRAASRRPRRPSDAPHGTCIPGPSEAGAPKLVALWFGQGVRCFDATQASAQVDMGAALVATGRMVCTFLAEESLAAICSEADLGGHEHDQLAEMFAALS